MISWKNVEFSKFFQTSWIRIAGVPQENQAGLVKTSARKKGIRAEAESLLGVLIKLNLSQNSFFYFFMKWSFCE